MKYRQIKLLYNAFNKLICAGFFTVSIIFTTQTVAQTMSNSDFEFIPYEAFLKNTMGADYDAFAKNESTRVNSEDEFVKMQRHVLKMYDGVVVKNTFVFEDGAHIDCIDMHTQPGLRRGGKTRKIAKPPSALIVDDDAGDKGEKSKAVEPMLSKEKKDRFGNPMYCAEGFIPMRRVTLEEITKFETLKDFFSKTGRAGKSGLPGGK